MKKSILTLAAVVVLSASTLPALASVGGANPRPQAVGGANPRPIDFMDGAYAAVVALFGF